MGQYKTWTLDLTVDWTLDSINNGLDIWTRILIASLTRGVRDHVKLLSIKVLTLLDVVSSSSVRCRNNNRRDWY